MAALEALDGVQGAAPEDAVVAEVQRALELGHGAAAIAVVQRGEGLRARRRAAARWPRWRPGSGCRRLDGASVERLRGELTGSRDALRRCHAAIRPRGRLLASAAVPPITDPCGQATRRGGRRRYQPKSLLLARFLARRSARRRSAEPMCRRRCRSARCSCARDSRAQAPSSASNLYHLLAQLHLVPRSRPIPARASPKFRCATWSTGRATTAISPHAVARRRELPPAMFRNLLARATDAVRKRLIDTAQPGDREGDQQDPRRDFAEASKPQTVSRSATIRRRSCRHRDAEAGRHCARDAGAVRQGAEARRDGRGAVAADRRFDRRHRPFPRRSVRRSDPDPVQGDRSRLEHRAAGAHGAASASCSCAKAAPRKRTRNTASCRPIRRSA